MCTMCTLYSLCLSLNEFLDDVEEAIQINFMYNVHYVYYVYFVYYVYYVNFVS